MPEGIIKKLVKDRGFGFIKTEQEEDLFFHSTQLQGVYFASLREGQEVEFELGRDRNDRPQAVNVRLAATESGQEEVAPSALEDVEATPAEPQAEETMQGDQD